MNPGPQIHSLDKPGYVFPQIHRKECCGSRVPIMREVGKTEKQLKMESCVICIIWVYLFYLYKLFDSTK